jgi:hypothetical protein
MRPSILRYMLIRGAVSGTGILMLIMILSSLLSNSGFRQVIIEGAGNNLLLAIGFYLTFALMPSFFLGGFGGGIIGLITGLCLERAVNHYSEHIIDADRYTRTLTLLTAGFSAVVTLMGILLFFRYSLSPLTPAGIALVAVVGGFIGRSFAHYDMKQRREKKQTAKEMPEMVERFIHRLELPEEFAGEVDKVRSIR